MNNNDNADYSQGKVYKIWSPNHDKVYYGSTVRTLATRMSIHRGACNPTTSKQIINAGDADIKLVEDFPCVNKDELQDREAEVMQADWDGCVNEKVPGAVRRAGGMKEYDKEWRKVNAVKISEKSKAYYEENAVKLIAYRKEYYEKNATKIKQQTKEYYEKNAEKIKAQKNGKIMCECGGKYRHGDRAKHFKTKKHQDHVEAEVASVMNDMISVLEAE